MVAAVGDAEGERDADEAEADAGCFEADDLGGEFPLLDGGAGAVVVGGGVVGDADDGVVADGEGASVRTKMPSPEMSRAWPGQSPTSTTTEMGARICSRVAQGSRRRLASWVKKRSSSARRARSTSPSRKPRRSRLPTSTR